MMSNMMKKMMVMIAKHLTGLVPSPSVMRCLQFRLSTQNSPRCGSIRR